MFNYSDVVLTDVMEKVLNRGLNFSILPLKLDITQTLVDFKYFERTMIWKEFWYGRDSMERKEKPIFKSKKMNLPKNHKTPNGLKTYLSSIKSELMDHKNRKHVKCNLPEAEIKALKELIRLQKERKIVIKKCDKGAGIIILNFDIYIQACVKHLEDKQSYENGETKNYYKKVDEATFEQAKVKLTKILDEGFDNEILTRFELDAMCPDGKNPGKFYSNFKVHKTHEHGEAPPVRPIVSCSGALQENPSAFVQYHLKEVSNKHETFLQDTPDFIRKVETFNDENKLPDNASLVTIDVKSLFTNIIHKEGIKASREALEERTVKDVPTEFIIRLLEFILKHNIFSFNEELFSQQIGASMGTKPAPEYANIFLARRIDGKLREIFEKYSDFPTNFLKRFLDDIFKIFVGSTKKLHEAFDEINKVHPTIKFTMSHTSIENESESDRCSCPEKKSIPFLDTSCQIEKGRIILDLYKKPTDRNMYLMLDSCTPPACTRNIPYSLAMRINRICTLPESREQRFSELKELLIAREYRNGMVDNAIAKARAISRKEALKYVSKPTLSKRPVFVVS